MSKLKIIVILVLVFVFYKGYTAFRDFEIGVGTRVAEIEKTAGFERQGEVIALMMYLGEPLELKEHLLVSSKKKCLSLKDKAEENSNAYGGRLVYECAIVDAIISGGKITEVVEELEVL